MIASIHIDLNFIGGILALLVMAIGSIPTALILIAIDYLGGRPWR